MLDFPFVQDCAGILEANQLLLERAMYKDLYTQEGIVAYVLILCDWLEGAGIVLFRSSKSLLSVLLFREDLEKMSAPTQKNIHTGELASGTAKVNGHGQSPPGEYIKW